MWTLKSWTKNRKTALSGQPLLPSANPLFFRSNAVHGFLAFEAKRDEGIQMKKGLSISIAVLQT
jgi:hypothetical protein